MDSDRPSHRSGDLFICFTYLKMSSRSSLSPNRSNNRDPPISLTTSLSRRLRTNRSIKGGASPAMFPSTRKKRNFENPEPSSPKVTCIGQVRVKSKKKKQGKRLRSLSTRRHNSFRDGFCKSTNLGTNYGSFGRNQVTLQEKSNNQRWVHLPFTICEALRAFGSEFTCLFPCRSSCFSSSAREKEKVETEEGHRSSLCTRWLVVDGGRRDIELMVRDENENEEDNVRVSRRQHVFDDLEIVNNRIEGCKEESSSSRLSICIPPKNALLLMRCRSDPLKMEALANRLWESTINLNHDLNVDDDDDYEDEIIQKTVDFIEFEANQETELKESIQEEREQILEINEEKEKEEDEVEITFFGSLFEEIVNQDEEIDDEMLDASELFEEGETGEESNIEKFNHLPKCLLLMMCEPKLSMEISKETWVSSKDFFRRQPNRKKPLPLPAPLPSMPIKPSDVQDESKVTVTAFTNGTKYDKLSKASFLVQPGRSSCSLPIRPSMAEILEQKLVNAVGYEPFVLTRCKSEPMRTVAAKLAPDTCYWKNRKLEPLRRATFGVGAAGIGF